MMNTPVKFELAKLLKEKGFVCIKSDKFWMNGFSYPKKDYNPITYQDKDNVATISDVVMWLYEKHGIWISVECDVYGKLWYAKSTVASKSLWENEDKRHEILTSFRKFPNEHDTPTKAYEAAIQYTLNNLI